MKDHQEACKFCLYARTFGDEEQYTECEAYYPLSHPSRKRYVHKMGHRVDAKQGTGHVCQRTSVTNKWSPSVRQVAQIGTSWLEDGRH